MFSTNRPLTWSGSWEKFGYKNHLTPVFLTTKHTYECNTASSILLITSLPSTLLLYKYNEFWIRTENPVLLTVLARPQYSNAMTCKMAIRIPAGKNSKKSMKEFLLYALCSYSNSFKYSAMQTSAGTYRHRHMHRSTSISGLAHLHWTHPYISIENFLTLIGCLKLN